MADKIIIILVAMICGISCFFGLFQKLDFHIYDLFLNLKKTTETRSELLLVDIDDYSIESFGDLPWNQYTYADLFIRMKELGAITTIFGFEFSNSIENYDGYFVSQLAIDSILSLIKPEKIIKNKNTIEIYGGNIPERSPEGKNFEWNKKNIVIPVDNYGRMFINWKYSNYTDSFRHLNISSLMQLNDIESSIYSFLTQINSINWLGSGMLSYKQKISDLIIAYDEICEYKKSLLSSYNDYNEIVQSVYDEYFTLRRNYFENILEFSNNCEENELVEIQNYLLDNIKLFGEDVVSDYGSWFEEAFSALNSAANLYKTSSDSCSAQLKNSLCFISQPESDNFYANLYNTILNQEFITSLDWYWGIIFSGILTLIFIGIINLKKIFVQLLLDLILFAIVIYAPIHLFFYKNLYVQVVAPSLIAFISFFLVSIYRFISADDDENNVESYIEKRLSRATPNVKSDELTVLFSNIKSFSSFSKAINNEELIKIRESNEKLSENEIALLSAKKGAERIVAILNEYLKVLSDVLITENGTIDKYVGDGIVSFFGAPIQDKNNAFNSCVAGIRMLQAESKFNEENKDKFPKNPKTGELFYLHSRIGINTGNMIVGNIGYDIKQNYTIMGNSVKFASRLEELNKLYASWILISETTWKKANSGENSGKLVARIFDVIKVSNSKRPVRIYNVLGLYSELSEEQIKAAEMFNEGMKWYMKDCDNSKIQKDLEDFRKAYAYYKYANELFPPDESSKIFMNRCANFLKNGIKGEWDGVYNLPQK